MALILPILLLACGGPEQQAPVSDIPTDVAEEEESTQPSEPSGPDPVAQLFRASLDLRGVRPTIAEIETIESDPEAYEELVNGYMNDPLFGDRIISMFAEVFLTRADSYTVDAESYGLSSELNFVFARSVGDETLRILSHIIENELPYTELVVGDWTMANEVLASAWPLDYPEGETGWKKVHYTDARPAAGMLASNSMWWRYMSTGSNANRGKANAVSRILLCNDYLSKSIEFDRTVNLLDQDALNDALRSNPGCATCHNSLDPLAAFLWGTYYTDYNSPHDLRYYHAEREHYWENYDYVAPAYYGQEGFGLADLGQFIAADPRFVECAVERVFTLMTQRDPVVGDTTKLTEWREAFIESDLNMKTLFREVALDDTYRATEVSDGSYATRKMVTSDMLGSQIEDLTGFVFIRDGVPVLDTDTQGLRTLAGGIDGQNVTRSATEPMTTLVLVQERYAQAASNYVVAWDRDHPEEARLFSEVDFHETPKTGEEEMVRQIQALHLRLFGHRIEADGPEVVANLELWEDLYEVSLTVEDAWAGLLTVLLRDPDFLFY
jgi:hypothetical protein